MESVPTRKIAKKIVKQILADLRGRSGLDGAWDGIDDDIQAEIVQEWEDIVFCELGGEQTS